MLELILYIKLVKNGGNNRTGQKSPVVDNDKLRCPLMALKRSREKYLVLIGEAKIGESSYSNLIRLAQD